MYAVIQTGGKQYRVAEGDRLDVELLGDDDGVSLIVHDDGAGLPAGVESNRLSHGIVGMRQRVRALDGTFKIGSRPGSGTTIEVFIPVRGQAPQADSQSSAAADADASPPRVDAAVTDALVHPTR